MSVPGEGSDAYPNVIAVLDHRARVIRSQDDATWILQTKVSLRDPDHMWKSVLCGESIYSHQYLVALHHKATTP